MTFTGSRWRCLVPGCTEPGELSAVLVLSTPGGRADRKQAITPAARLCKSHSLALAAGVVHEVLRRRIDAAVISLKGEEWQPKPKRVK